MEKAGPIKECDDFQKFQWPIPVRPGDQPAAGYPKQSSSSWYLPAFTKLKKHIVKIKTLVTALAIATLPVLASAQQAAASAAAAAQAGQAGALDPELWLNRMTDFTQNMSAFKDSKVFVPGLTP